MSSRRRQFSFFLVASVASMLAIILTFDFNHADSWAATLVPSQIIGQLPASSQLPATPTTLPTALFSSPNFLLAVVIGVVMAFAFQLLFANLAIAVMASPDSPSDHNDGDSESLGEMVRGIETKVGLGLLISVSIALFVASFLAVKLSLVSSPLLGSIVGVSIWAIFFTLLTWLGSTTLGSLLGSFISTATAGIQGLLGTGGALLGANFAKNQAVSTAEDITAAVRRELTAGFDPDTIRTTLQSSLDKVQLPKLNLDQLGGQFAKLLKDADLDSVADSDLLKNVNRDTFVKLVSTRTDLSKKDINHISDQLEAAWQQVVGSKQEPFDPQALLKQLKSAAPDDLKSGKLSDQLNNLIKSASPQRKSGGSLTSQALQFGTTALLSRVLQNVDISDIDVEKIGGQLRTFGSNLLEGENGSHASNGSKNGHSNGKPKSFSVVQADLENYLLFSPPWKLNRETVKQEFRDVIYDGDADPGLLRQELEQIDQAYFLQVLSLRDDLPADKNQEVAENLEEIRAEVFNTVHTAEAEKKSQDLHTRVANYIRSTDKADLNPKKIQQDFQALLEDPDTDWEEFNTRLRPFDRETLAEMLSQRQDISTEEAKQIGEQLSQTRDQVLSKAQELQDKMQGQAQALRQKISDYLRNTQLEELNPEGIQRDFKKLLEDPAAGASALKGRMAQFDRETLVELLSQRQDLSPEQVNQVIDQVESVWKNILHAPQDLANKAKDQYDHTTQALSDYLRNTNLDELNPEGIQRDLAQLFKDPKSGASALQTRLSHMDRETLVTLLSQREDLTEEQINQAIDQIQSAIRNIIKAPRRLASRVKEQAVDFEANLESYLRNTDKDELNPEGIKRDLQLLLQDPKAGLSSLGERASHFDRSTFVALLSQREDMTEEEANRIADQVEANFRAVVEQLQKVQQAIQATIDKGFDNVRDYLNRLERPELNYDGIKQDFGQLFNDPQMGLEALRDRLTQFDRATLVAVISSRDDISADDANGIIDQVEAARDSVLHQMERVQQETQKRLKAITDEAQRQVRGTRKMAAGAAWWVFSSALFSLASSSLAGFLAVSQYVIR